MFTTKKGIRWMRLSHARRAVSARFDDPNLVSCAGLAPIMALAVRCGLATLLTQRLRIAARGGANATTKVLALIAGMIAGADSIDDMDLLRHGGMTRLFTDIRAPSTLGTFLRVFTVGHVRQLDAVAAELPARLAAATPILPGLSTVAFLDIDDTVRQTYGNAKQGAGRGYSGVKGLNALITTLSTPLAAPVIGTLRRECLDHLLITGPRHLDVVLREYMQHFNTHRTDHSISAHPQATLRHVPARPSGRSGKIGSAASSTNTCRSHEVTLFSAPTRCRRC